jgi:hypothetical protein
MAVGKRRDFKELTEFTIFISQPWATKFPAGCSELQPVAVSCGELHGGGCATLRFPIYDWPLKGHTPRLVELV